jgi:hypothetical protein
MDAADTGLIDFVHEKLNQEVHAIGGHYMFTDEIRLPYGDREILVLAGSAVFDRTCCGYTGFGYALVPGFIVDYKYKTNKDGLSVSRMEPIRHETVQSEIRSLISQKESIQQVKFR